MLSSSGIGGDGDGDFYSLVFSVVNFGQIEDM